MSRKFDLKIVISAISVSNIADDFNDVFELYWYVFDDPTITTTGLPILRRDLLNHLEKTFPGLREAEYKAHTRYGVLLQEYGKELEVLSIKEFEEEKTFVDDKKRSKKNTKKKNKK